MARTSKRRWKPSALLRGTVALHAAGAVTVAAAPAAWPWALGACLASHVAVVTAGLLPRSRWLGPNLTRLPADRAARGEVALTFDDGPDPEVTPRVLRLLRDAGAGATFFCIGRRAEVCPGVVERIRADGHRVENHTSSHPNSFSFFGPGRLGREIDDAQATLERLAGAAPVWFRAPAGIRNPLVHKVLDERGLGLASWTRRGFDTVTRDPARVAARLLSGLSAGDVLALHDGSCARAADGTPVVLGALESVLAALEERGLRAVPLPVPGGRDGA